MPQPMNSPVTDMTTTPIIEWMRLEMLRATTTAERPMGSERNRSTMPLPMSVLRPIATTKALNVIVWAMIPGQQPLLVVDPGDADRAAEHEGEEQDEHHRLDR